MNNRIAETLKSNQILAVLILLVSIGVLVFDIFHYSTSYGIVEIKSLNSLFNRNVSVKRKQRLQKP